MPKLRILIGHSALDFTGQAGPPFTPPEAFTILRVGKFFDVGRKVLVDVDRAMLTKLAAQFDRDGIPIPIDFEHGILKSAVKGGGKVDIAGHINAVTVEGDALVARVEYWTEDGRDAIAAGKYRFQSPVIAWNAPDRQTGTRGPLLHSVALTTTPNLLDQKPLAASLGSLLDDGGDPSNEPKGKTAMGEIIKLLVSMFGMTLADAADEAAVLEAIKSLAGRVPPELVAALNFDTTDGAVCTVAEAVKLATAEPDPTVPADVRSALALAEGATIADATTAILALQNKQPDVSALTDSVRQGLADDALLDAATKDGRIDPEDKKTIGVYTNLLRSADPKVRENTRVAIAAMKPGGPLSADLGPTADRVKGVSTLAVNVANQIGVDPKDMNDEKFTWT